MEGCVERRAVQEWILFIKTKNIDPVAKNRFIQAIDYLRTELGSVKTQLEAVQDGTLQKEKMQYALGGKPQNRCIEKIGRLIAELDALKERERSALYGKLISSVCFIIAGNAPQSNRHLLSEK